MKGSGLRVLGQQLCLVENEGMDERVATTIQG